MKSSVFSMAHAALTSCENKITFCERSYAHCSMCRYVHSRTHTCACVSHLMEGSARLNQVQRMPRHSRTHVRARVLARAHAHTRTRAHTHGSHTRAYANAHAPRRAMTHAHARTRARTHTRTHTCTHGDTRTCTRAWGVHTHFFTPRRHCSQVSDQAKQKKTPTMFASDRPGKTKNKQAPGVRYQMARCLQPDKTASTT